MPRTGTSEADTPTFGLNEAPTSSRIVGGNAPDIVARVPEDVLGRIAILRVDFQSPLLSLLPLLDAGAVRLRGKLYSPLAATGDGGDDTCGPVYLWWLIPVAILLVVGGCGGPPKKRRCKCEVYCKFTNLSGYVQKDDQSLYDQGEFDAGDCGAECEKSCKDKAEAQQTDLNLQMMDEAPKRGATSNYGKEHGFVTVHIEGGADSRDIEVAPQGHWDCEAKPHCV